MDLQADAVAEAVHEVLAMPGVCDDVPGGRVHVTECSPSPQRCATSRLRLSHQSLEILLPLRWCPEPHRARHVGVLTIDPADGPMPEARSVIAVTVR